MPEKLEVMRVGAKDVVAADGGRKVVLSESHPEHPGGAVFIVADGKIHKVALTKRVRHLLGEGVLREAKSSSGSDVPPLRPATEAEEDAARLTGTVEKQTARVPERKGNN